MRKRARENDADDTDSGDGPGRNLRLTPETLVYEYFIENYPAYASKLLGKVADELERETDFDVPDLVISHGNQTNTKAEATLKIEMKRVEIKAHADVVANRPKLYGDIIFRANEASLDMIKRHHLYEEAKAAKSPRMLWQIIKLTHETDEYAGAMGKIFKRKKLFSLLQGTKTIEEHASVYRRIFNQILASKDPLVTTQLAGEQFLGSLAPEFAPELNRWSRDNKGIPKTLEEAIQLVTAFKRQDTSTKRGLGDNPRSETPAEVPLMTVSDHQKQKTHGKKFRKPFVKRNKDMKKKFKTPHKSKEFTHNTVSVVKSAWNIIIHTAKPQHEVKGDTIIYDTGASVSVWNNTAGITNIKTLPEPITVEGLGKQEITQIGHHPVYGKVHILPNLWTSIVSPNAIRHHTSTVLLDDTYTISKGNDKMLFQFDKDIGLYVFQPESIKTEPPKVNTLKRDYQRAQRARELCKNLGHIGNKALKDGLRHGCYLEADVTVADVDTAQALLGPCPGCQAGKLTNSSSAPIIRTDHYKSDILDDILHADIFYVPGAHGKTMSILLTVGEYTRYVQIGKLESKSKLDLENGWSTHIATFSKHGIKVSNIVTDNEVSITATRKYLSEKHQVELIQRASSTHEPMAERKIQHLKSRARSILSDPTREYKIPARLYLHGYIWAVQGINHSLDSLNTPDDVRTAADRVEGIKTNIKTFAKYSFGEVVTYRLTADKELRAVERGIQGLVIGRDANNDRYLVYNPVTKRTATPKTIQKSEITSALREKILELAKFDSIPYKDLRANASLRGQRIEELAEDGLNMDSGEEPIPDTAEARSEEAPPVNETEVHETPVETTTEIEPNTISMDPTSTLEGQSDEVDNQEAEAAPTSETTTTTTVSRYGRHIKANGKYAAAMFHVHAYATSEAVFLNRHGPREAFQFRPEEAKTATLAELENMLTNNVFVPMNPSSKLTSKPLPSSINYVDKHDANGKAGIYKARLCAGGHRQDYTTFDEASSPTVAWETVLTTLAIAAHQNLDICIGDVKSAYLHANREGNTDVYIVLNPIVAEHLIMLKPTWKQYVHRSKGTMTVKLIKAMYGLKDSGLHWYLHLSKKLEELGFTATQSDPCAFTYKDKDKIKMILLIYVDDLLGVGKKTLLVRIFEELAQSFSGIKYKLNEDLQYIGTNIVKQGRQIHVNCTGYTNKLVKDHGIHTDANTPFPSTFDPKSDDTTDLLDPTLTTTYRELTMSLMYLAKRTRPDILFHTSYLASYMQTPTLRKLKLCRYVLSYLHKTQDLGITFGTSNQVLEAHADSSFNTYADNRSQAGIIIEAFGGPVFFKSYRIHHVVKDSNEAEIIACDAAIDLTLWFRELLKELGFTMEGPTNITQDNTSAITIINRGRIKRKRGSIQVKLSYLKQCITRRQVELVKVPTDEMKADLLTKNLIASKLEALRDLIVKRKK
jgi:hypothetical protein